MQAPRVLCSAKALKVPAGHGSSVAAGVSQLCVARGSKEEGMGEEEGGEHSGL